MRWYANVKEVGGGDTTVVLVHGYGANQTLWDKLLPVLSEHHRVILFAHLVLLCASPRYIDSPEEGYVGGFDRASIDGMLGAMSSDFGAWVKGFVPNAAGGDPSASPALEQSFLSMHPGVALEVARMIFLGDQRGALDAVAVPCTVVQVAADFAASPAVAEYMQRRMEKAAEVEVVVIDSVGHFPQLVAPQQLLAVLQRVLQRTGGEVVVGAEEEQAAEVVEADGGR